MTQQLPDALQRGAPASPQRSGPLISPIEWTTLGPLPIERLLSAQPKSADTATSVALPQAAREALRHWNQFVESGAQAAHDGFFAHAQALWQSAVELEGGGAGWLLPIGRIEEGKRAPRLSASMQALAISTLARVYALTDDANIIRLANAAARALQRDIFDGGAGAPIAALGALPQDVAVYPADHGLAGVMLSLLALHELSAVDPTEAIALRDQMTRTFQRALPAYDLEHGIRDTLTAWGYASEPSYRVCLALLRGLARTTGDPLYETTAARWKRYGRSWAAARRSLSRVRSGAGKLGWNVARGLTRRGAPARPPHPLEN
ncbi:MAG TPA: D-glucuronyl C5-epimerase family protein, partial [Ktedonobacterales bacterium]